MLNSKACVLQTTQGNGKASYGLKKNTCKTAWDKNRRKIPIRKLVKDWYGKFTTEKVRMANKPDLGECVQYQC